MRRQDRATVRVHTEDGQEITATIRIDTHSTGHVVLQVDADKPGEPDRTLLWRHAMKVPKPPLPDELGPEYIDRVREDWRKYWRGQDHPYDRFSTFLGERILTDFNLRD